MVDIGYHLKNHGVTLTVSVWHNNQDITPTYELEEAWVHITRVKVGLLDKSQLPLTTDLVFGTEGYLITYTLEDELFVPPAVTAEDVDPMDQDDFGAGNGGNENPESEMAAKKLKSDSKMDPSASQSGSAGPTPMQHLFAVTPLGKRRPCPPPKPLVFLKKDDKLPPIAVTVPKMGFRPDSGCIASKYHPLFFRIYGDLNLCSQPHASCSVVDSGLSEKEAAGTVKPVHQSP